MNTHNLTHWEDVIGRLVDSDGVSVCRENAMRLMREYRDTGAIAGHFIMDEDGKFDWDTAPSASEIFWFGLDDAMIDEGVI